MAVSKVKPFLSALRTVSGRQVASYELTRPLVFPLRKGLDDARPDRTATGRGEASYTHLHDSVVLHSLVGTSGEANRALSGGHVVSQSQKERVTVLMLTWFNAKPKHVFKYTDFYLRQGLDVIEVKMKPYILLSQVRTTPIIDALLAYLASQERNSKLFFHIFSGGCYTYTQMVMKARGREHYDDLLGNISGVFVDSYAGARSAGQGTAGSLTSPPLLRPLRPLVGKLMDLYLDHFLPGHVNKTQRSLDENTINVPWCINYSPADPVGNAKGNEALAEDLRRQGLPVKLKSWEDAPHVQILANYPKEYIQALEDFMISLKLIENKGKD